MGLARCAPWRMVRMCFYEEFIFNKGELYGILGLPFKRAWLWGVLGDLRVIFIHAESAPSVARFRAALSVLVLAWLRIFPK